MNRFMIGEYIRKQREAKEINQDDLCRGICNVASVTARPYPGSSTADMSRTIMC